MNSIDSAASTAAQAASAPTPIRALLMALALGALAVFSATFSATASAQNVPDSAQYISMDTSGQPTPVTGACARYIITRKTSTGGDFNLAQLGELDVSFVGQVNAEVLPQGENAGIVTFPAGVDRIEFMVTTDTSRKDTKIVGTVNAEPTAQNCSVSDQVGSVSAVSGSDVRGWRITLWCAGKVPVRARDCLASNPLIPNTYSGYRMAPTAPGKDPGNLNFVHSGYGGGQKEGALPAANIGPEIIGTGPTDQTIAPGADASALRGMADFFRDGNAPGAVVVANTNGTTPYIRQNLRFTLLRADTMQSGVSNPSTVPGIGIDRFTGKFTGTMSQHTPEGTTYKVGIEAVDYNGERVYGSFTLTASGTPPPPVTPPPVGEDPTPRMELVPDDVATTDRNETYTITSTGVTINFRRVAGTDGIVSAARPASASLSPTLSDYLQTRTDDNKDWTATIGVGEMTGSVTIDRVFNIEPNVGSAAVMQTIWILADSSTVFTDPDGNDVPSSAFPTHILMIPMRDSVPYFEFSELKPGPTDDPYKVAFARKGNNNDAATLSVSVTNAVPSDAVAVAGTSALSFPASDGTSNRTASFTVERTTPGPAGTGNGNITVSIIADPADPDAYGRGTNHTKTFAISRAAPSPGDTTPRMELVPDNPATTNVNETYTITSTGVTINFRRVAGTDGAVSTARPASASLNPTLSDYLQTKTDDNKDWTATIGVGEMTGSVTIDRMFNLEPNVSSAAVMQTIWILADSSTVFTDPDGNDVPSSAFPTHTLMIPMRDSVPYFEFSELKPGSTDDPYEVTVARKGNNNDAANVSVSVTNAVPSDAVAVARTSALSFLASDGTSNRTAIFTVERTTPGPIGTGNGRITVSIIADPADPDTYGRGTNHTRGFLISRAAPPTGDTTPRMELDDPAYTITSTGVTINFRRVAGTDGVVSTARPASASLNPTLSDYLQTRTDDNKDWTATIGVGEMTGSVTIDRVFNLEPNVSSAAVMQTIWILANSSTVFTDPDGNDVPSSAFPTHTLMIPMRDSVPYFEFSESKPGPTDDPYEITVARKGNNNDAANVSVSVTNAVPSDAVAVAGTSALSFLASDGTSNRTAIFTVERTTPGPIGTGNGRITVSIIEDPADPDTYGRGTNHTRSPLISRAAPPTGDTTPRMELVPDNPATTNVNETYTITSTGVTINFRRVVGTDGVVSTARPASASLSPTLSDYLQTKTDDNKDWTATIGVGEMTGSVTIDRMFNLEPNVSSAAVMQTIWILADSSTVFTDPDGNDVPSSAFPTHTLMIPMRDSVPYFEFSELKPGPADDPYKVGFVRRGNNNDAATLSVSVTNAVPSDAVAVAGTSALSFLASDGTSNRTAIFTVERTTPAPPGTGNGNITVSIIEDPADPDAYGRGTSHTKTFAISRASAAPNTAPTLRAAASPDITVREDAVADDTAGGSFTVADAEQTTVTVQRCVDAVAGTACTVFANAAAGNIGGIYGNFTLTNAGVWNYTLDNQCGTTPGRQGTTADAGEAGDLGCATDALAGDENPAPTDVLRIRVDDGTADATTAAGTGTSRYSRTEVVTVTITGVNDKPVITPATNLSMNEDDVLFGTLIGRAFAVSDFAYADPEVGAYHIVFAAGPVIKDATSTSAGKLNEFNDTGDDVTSYPFAMGSLDITNYAYVPVNRSANYTAQFTITPEDSDDLVGEQKTLEIMVTADNDAPTVVSTLPAVAPGTYGAAYSQPLAGFFEDVDSTNLTYALSEACTGFVIGGTDNGFLVGSDGGDIPSTVTTDTTCMVTATDGTGTSPPASLAIDISAPNTAPTVVGTPTAASATYGMAYSQPLTGFFEDAEGDTLTYSITTGTCTGFTIGGMDNGFLVGAGTNPEGSVTATAADTPCTVTANDGTVDSAPASFSIAVTFPAAVVSLGTPLPTGYDVDTKAAITFPLVRTGDPRNALLVSITVGITDPGGANRRNPISRAATIPANEKGVTATIPYGQSNTDDTRLGTAMPGDTITFTIAVDITERGNYTISGATSFMVAVGGNTPPRLAEVMTPMPDKEVTEDDNANDTAGGSFTVTDAEQTSAVTVQRCVDAAAGTACTAFANAAAGNIGGIYGNFTLTNAGVWTYTLDNQCGTTPGIQGTTADAGEAGDPGCATDALVGDENPAPTDVLRIRVDDGTADATTAAGSGTSRYSRTEVVTVTITGANDKPVITPASSLSMSEDDILFGTLRGRAFAVSDFGYADPEGGAYDIVFAARPVIKDATSTNAGELNSFQDDGSNVTSYPFKLPFSDIANYAYVPVNRSSDYTAQFTITPEDTDDLQGEQKTLEIMVTADNDAPTVVGTGNRPAVARGNLRGGIQPAPGRVLRGC